MDKYKKIIIFFLCLCIAFFPIVSSLTIQAASNNFADVYGYDLIDRGTWTNSGWTSSSIYNSRIQGLPNYGTFSDTIKQTINNLSVEGVSISDYPSFFIFSDLSNVSDKMTFYIYFLHEGARIGFSGTTSYYGYIYNSEYTDYQRMKVELKPSNGSIISSSIQNLDFGSSKCTSFSTSSTKLICSNIDDIYGTLDRTDSAKYWFFDSTMNLSKGAKINYLLYDNEGNIDYNNPITNPVYQESSSNNLYMDNAKWSFDIPFYSLDQSGAVYGTGTATFSGSLNEFQINNTSDFTLEFLFTSFLSGYRYSWAQDSEKEDFSYKYIYSTEISLSDFYTNGQVASFNISDIFDNSISVNPTHLGTSITEDCSVISNSQAVNISNWNTTFTVALKSNNEYSGKCSTMYSYLLRKSKNKDNSMQTNENPFLGEEGFNSSPDSDIFNGDGVSGSSGNSNSNANIGDYSVVNNNNPQITINNNNDNGFTNAIENGDSDGLLSKLLLLLANNQSTTSNGLSEIADTDGYVQVMGSVFTAVPVSWWTTLTVAFVACIGILVVSFVIKIILKFVI